MKCTKCKKDNIKKANYCRYCGKSFSEIEKEKAKQEGFIAKLKEAEKWYKRLTLKVIFDSTIFKIAILVFVVLVGILNLSKGNIHLHLKESEKYKIEYNETKDEYYVILNKQAEDETDKVDLELFIPNRVTKIETIKYSENDTEISRKEYKINENISLYANTINNDYYIIKDDIESDKEIKVFVYLEN